MNHAPGTGIAGNGSFDPRQAAELDQATRQARRQFVPFPPLLWAVRAIVVLVVFGGCWLSVRGQRPYSGPSGRALAVAFALVAVSIVLSACAIRPAVRGISGPPQRARLAWNGAMKVVLIAAYAVMPRLYHAGASHPAWGLYPASAPLLIVGLAGAAIAAGRRDWPIAGIWLVLAVVAAAAGFGGPAGAWLITGIGLSTVCLGTAAVTAWQQRPGES